LFAFGILDIELQLSIIKNKRLLKNYYIDIECIITICNTISSL